MRERGCGVVVVVVAVRSLCVEGDELRMEFGFARQEGVVNGLGNEPPYQQFDAQEN